MLALSHLGAWLRIVQSFSLLLCPRSLPWVFVKLSFNKVVENKWTITTNWLTQDEVNLLKEAVQSPQTWAYIGQEDFPYTCKIAESTYTVKTIKQVKLFTATFNIEINTDRTMQIV